MLPTLAIIGRPNVGKSTLFNRLVGKKLALVDDSPGVTRDRREGEARLSDLSFRVIDTAGYEDEDAATLPGRMRAQTEYAVANAAAVLLLVDGREGITPLDEEIARWLRESGRPVVLAVNKTESRHGRGGLIESFALGLGEPVAISAEHGDGMADLFGALAPHLEAAADERREPESAPEDAPLKLAVVGRPNAGKSTLLNRMLGENRLVTGPEAGITRDSIAIDWSWTDRRAAGEEGTERRIRLIDTAGMRKRPKVRDKLEKLSVADARRAVEFAEVVILLLDASRGLEAQDLRIADFILEEGRALLVAINKWDIAEGRRELLSGIRHALAEGLGQVRDVPLIAVSAITGEGMDELLAAAFELREAWSRRIPTGELNRWLGDAVAANPPPAPRGKRIKLRYITQAKTRPPTFILFGTRIDRLPESYRRYLLNALRRDLGFGPVPVRMTLRAGKNPYGG